MNPVIFENGTKRWYNDNRLRHREDGPAVQYKSGTNFWYINGKLHRINGPAVDDIHYKKWFVNGKLHRLDGPAIDYIGGYKEWYINGIQINCKDNEEFLRIVKMKELL
jgi:hypothetical protein